jgi:hypothetical protein
MSPSLNNPGPVDDNRQVTAHRVGAPNHHQNTGSGEKVMVDPPQDARRVPLSDVDKLRQDAHAAAEIRALQTHPDVVALRVEKVRKQVDRMMWAGIWLGLAYTMVNVQQFAAAGAVVWSLPWLSAWLFDPMVSVVLVAVLRAEQITARYQVEMRTDTIGPWVRRTKVFAFLATYVMNTWQSWAALHVAGIVLHSVPPVLVYLAAETGPILRDRLTEAVLSAARPVNATGLVQTLVPSTPADAATATVPVKPATRSRKPATKAPNRPRRKLLADYLTEARAAYTPGVEVTPAWVRQVSPEISRGTSQNVADKLTAELAARATAQVAADDLTTEPVADQSTEALVALADERRAA